MACETVLRPRQTAAQRAEDIRRSISTLNAGLASGSIKALVSAKGGVAFPGWNEQDRDGVSDACALRKIMSSGNTLAKLAVAKAEQVAGRAIDKSLVASGHHSHVAPDGTRTWHKGHSH